MNGDQPVTPSALDNQGAKGTPRSTFSNVQMITGLVLGLVVGAAASWGLLFGHIDRGLDALESGLHLILPIFGAFTLALVIVLPLTWWAVRRFLAGARGTIDAIISAGANAARAANEGNVAAVSSNVEKALIEAAAWYAPAAARRWIAQTALALLIAFGGLIGTTLLFRQTVLLGEQNNKISQQIELLQDQNRKIDLQTVTAEAQRRSVLYPELFAILQSIPDVTSKGSTSIAEEFELPLGLKARVLALSRAAQPYRTVELNYNGVETKVELASRIRSPERGLLLLGLASATINVSKVQNSIFDHADLRNQFFEKADFSSMALSFIDAEGATFRKIRFAGAEMHGARFIESSLFECDFTKTKVGRLKFTNGSMLRTTFKGADLQYSDFSDSTIEAIFDDADLRGVKFVDSIFINASFRNAILIEANFQGVDLANLDLDGAKVAERRRPNERPYNFNLPDIYEYRSEEEHIVIRKKI